MASLTVAGCVTPEDEAGTGEEVASEQVAGDETASREVETEANLASIEIRNVTCYSGWPGTRGCSWVFTSSTAIVPGTLTVQINGHNGELGHTLSQISATKVSFTATVREGDAFNPGKNTTSYTVAWLRN